MSDPQQPIPEVEAPLDDVIRPHVFDGNIREYDKRLPNWWLFSLYGSIAFALGYWIVVHEWHLTREQGLALERQMEANKIAASQRAGEINDEVLWTMSR